MAHPVNWFSIQARDGSKLVEFYKAIFGWKTSSMPGDTSGTVMVAADKGGIPGGVGSTVDGSEKAVTVYVSVPNLAATLEHIDHHGGRQAMPIQELPGGMGSVAGFVDPGGNWIGLWQAAPKPAVRRAPAKKPARSTKKATTRTSKKKAAKGKKKSKR